jgi:hypothetical protein
MAFGGSLRFLGGIQQALGEGRLRKRWGDTFTRIC